MSSWVEAVGAANSLELVMDKILPCLTEDIIPHQVPAKSPTVIEKFRSRFLYYFAAGNVKFRSDHRKIP
jgi:hypothetical protein